MARYNRCRVIGLKLKGLTFREIGQVLNRSKTTAHRYFWQAMRGPE